MRLLRGMRRSLCYAISTLFPHSNGPHDRRCFSFGCLAKFYDVGIIDEDAGDFESSETVKPVFHMSWSTGSSLRDVL